MASSNDLSVLVTDVSGATTRWGSDEPDAELIPRNLSFSTQRGQGFAVGNCTLRRQIDRDYFDLRLLDQIEFVGADGDTAYEGRVGALPRSFDTSPSVTVVAAGYMSHAADRSFREIFVDRDLGRWQGPGPARQAARLATGFNPSGPQTSRDTTGAVLETGLDDPGGWLAINKPIVEAWYDSGGIPLSELRFGWQHVGNVTANDPAWAWEAFLADRDDRGSIGGYDAALALKAVSPSDRTLTATAASRVFAVLWFYATGPGGTAGSNNHYQINWRDIAVYGDHPLRAGDTAPSGVTASQVIRHVAGRYAPLLDTSQVTDTTFVIPHLVFDAPTTPFEAFQRVNAYHLWEMAVWEKRRLEYRPLDLSDHDWEIRTDDPGVSITLQGDTVDDLRNGIVVQFTDVLTGKQVTLTPDQYPELRDLDERNPATQHGIAKWGDLFQLSIPSTLDGALQIGRMALAEFNAPKAPGSITVSHRVRDRAGNWQPAWKVRGGDRVAITSSASLSDRPRVIQETTYDHDSRTVTIAVDASMRRLDAVMDRVSTALAANNLS